MSPAIFMIAAFSAVGVTVVTAGVLRNRFFAIFVGVFLSVQTLITVGLYEHAQPFWPVVVYLQLSVYLHFLSLCRARMRGPLFRALVTVPALFFAAGTLLCLPLAVVNAFGLEPWGLGIPFVVAAVGVVQSLRSDEEIVHLALDDAPVKKLRRHRRGTPSPATPLRIAQITDPHLGPLMSVQRMRGICERAVAKDPHIIVITGDFLTMESQSDPRTLTDALEPLASFRGRVFACFGNHDHEAPQIVRSACKEHGIELLVDEEALIETDAGSVQLVGADFSFRQRRERLEALAHKYPRRPGHMRIWLLHDPGAFRHLPDGDADLVLAGHTHGGQLGLLSLGLPWTVVSSFTSIPDHGLWALGSNRLYVHRGTGVYGFPLRVGVPGEESVLHVQGAQRATG